jgi:hypothetical protein
MPETTLARYYRALDEDRIDDAVAMLDPEVRFVIVLPGGARRGDGREDMRAYLTGRGVVRTHVILRETHEADVDFVYGAVTEGEATTGRFLAGARIGADGLVASYQVTFETEHVLVES